MLKSAVKNKIKEKMISYQDGRIVYRI